MKNLEIEEILHKKIPTKDIFVNEPMSKHTSFKIGGDADIFINATTVDTIKYVLEISKKYNINLTIIGNGTNILVKDNGIRGIVLCICLSNITIEKLENYAIVTVDAGNKLPAVAVELQKNAITGFEFASGIPGTIGGAIKMNAGAYSKEMKDIVQKTICMDYEGNIIELNNEQQKFDYRSSIFSKNKYIILQTILKLEYGNKEEIQSKMDEYKIKRKEKQPNLPSAGSTFKRGKDFITAKLIDECGLRGYKIGGAEVSSMHAGFIVNSDNAKAKDVLELIEYVKNKVYEKTNKNIELEVEILGE